MYALRYPTKSSTYPTLVELNRPQRAKMLDSLDGGFDENDRTYVFCTSARAHQWVRDDGLHETRLWIDHDNRIRA